MKVEKALEENGKIVATVYTDCYAMLDGGGRLCWWYKETHKLYKPVCLAAILGDYWLPYHEEKEIRPEKAGELWVNDKGGSFYTYEGNHGAILTIHVSGVAMPKDFIHGEGGWRRLYPPVEDESVERIEIKPTIKLVNYPGNSTYLFELPDGYVNRVNQKRLIIEIPKEE